jgi:hypothetical protein
LIINRKKEIVQIDWVLVIELLIRQGVENDEDLMGLIVDEFSLSDRTI